MTDSLNEVESLLAIDVGSANTRAWLFDITEGRYRFLATGVAPSTACAPYRDISEGVRIAIDDLQTISGRKLIGENERLIVPAQPNGNGVDRVVATLSAGPALKTVIVGLLPDVSLESAQRLAASLYAQIVDIIGLNDRRKTVSQIDSIIRLRPDLIIFAGGVENGASQSVLKLLETIRITCSILPESNRPEILYAGNQKLNNEVSTALHALTPIHFAPNIKPTIDSESLGPAQAVLSRVFARLQDKKWGGIADLKLITGDHIHTTATAFGRIIRFLSRMNDPHKYVLGVDLGASSTTIAASQGGELTLSVSTPLGMGEGLNGLIQKTSSNEISRWLVQAASDDNVRDYIYNKLLYPNHLPVSPEALEIDHALARQILRLAIQSASLHLPKGVINPGNAVTYNCDPILICGGVLTTSPTLGQCAMMVLDGLQPAGITTLILDKNNLIPALGSIAELNSYLPVQVMDSGAFINLATVVSPVCDVKPGTVIMRVRLVTDKEKETTLDIKQGTIEVLPLPQGQVARLHLISYHGTDIGMGGPGRGGTIKIGGGMLGLVIDARGRPIRLPEDIARRQELLKKWRWVFDGQT